MPRRSSIDCILQPGSDITERVSDHDRHTRRSWVAYAATGISQGWRRGQGRSWRHWHCIQSHKVSVVACCVIKESHPRASSDAPRERTATLDHNGIKSICSGAIIAEPCTALAIASRCRGCGWQCEAPGARSPRNGRSFAMLLLLLKTIGSYITSTFLCSSSCTAVYLSHLVATSLM